MPNKTTQILKEFRKNFVPVIMGDVTIRLPSKYHDKRTYTALQEFITEALSQQQQEADQWEKRFMELKKYLLFQERMAETHHAGRTEGDELILLETINEHVEEIEESEY
jgi:acyl carrier protein phosphodiesterase